MQIMKKKEKLDPLGYSPIGQPVYEALATSFS